MREKALGDLVWGILLLILVFFLFWESTRTPQVFEWYRYNNVFWPRIVLAVLSLFSLVIALRGAFVLRRTRASEPGLGQEQGERDPSKVWTKFFATGVFYTAYLFSLPWLGFIVATPVMIIMNMVILGERKILRMVSTALITTALFVFLFARIIGIDFPRGESILRELSFIFY